MLQVFIVCDIIISIVVITIIIITLLFLPFVAENLSSCSDRICRYTGPRTEVFIRLGPFSQIYIPRNFLRTNDDQE